MTIDKLYSKLQDLVPGNQLSNEDINVLYKLILSNELDLSYIERQSINAYTYIQSMDSSVITTIYDVRLYIINDIIGKQNSVFGNNNSDVTNGYSIDRTENGSIGLNTDTSKNTVQSLYIENNNIVYDKTHFDDIIDISINELKLNIKNDTPDLNNRIDELLRTIADLQSDVQLKDDIIGGNSSTIDELKQAITLLEENYEQLNYSSNNASSSQLSDLQDSINNLRIELKSNENIDDNQQLQLDAVPQLIKNAIDNLKKSGSGGGFGEETADDAGSGFNDVDNVGESG